MALRVVSGHFSARWSGLHPPTPRVGPANVIGAGGPPQDHRRIGYALCTLSPSGNGRGRKLRRGLRADPQDRVRGVLFEGRGHPLRRQGAQQEAVPRGRGDIRRPYASGGERPGPARRGARTMHLVSVCVCVRVFVARTSVTVHTCVCTSVGVCVCTCVCVCVLLVTARRLVRCLNIFLFF